MAAEDAHLHRELLRFMKRIDKNERVMLMLLGAIAAFLGVKVV